MVAQKDHNGKMIFGCEACGLWYAEKEYARKCEDFCKDHHSCSLEITRHALR